MSDPVQLKPFVGEDDPPDPPWVIELFNAQTLDEINAVTVGEPLAASARQADFNEELHPRERGRFTNKDTPSVDKPEGQSDTAEDRPSTAKDFAFRNAAVEGLSQEQQSAVIWEQRERYEPVDFLVAGAAQWNEQQGLPPIPEGIIDTPVDLAEADAVATYFENTDDMSGDPAVQEAYDDFIRQSDEMFDYMTRPESEGGLGVSVDFVHSEGGDPYPTAEAQAEDLRQNSHINLESGLGGAHGATMTTEQYDRFRAVHDVFGHAAIGGGFDRHGEYQAWLMHSAMYTPPGRDAMATEYHGVNSALWAGAPGSPGTGRSILLPEPYSDPPWERASLAAMGDPPPTVSPETRAVLDKLGALGPKWANQYEPWPWHFKNQTAAQQAAAGDEPPTPTQIKRSIDRLHKQREILGRKLLAGAEIAYAEALRRAGVKVATRARSRGTSKTVQAQARAALVNGSSLRPLLGVLGLREQDILAGSFTTYEDQAGGWMDDYRKRQLAEIIRLGLDPHDFGFDDASSIAEVTQAAGVGVIVGGLMALARGRLLGGVDHIMPGEVAGAIPAKLVLDGIKVAEGRSTATLGETLDDPPTVTDLPGADTVESGLADLVDGQTEYTWAHGFYGDPTTPFEPHELLDGFATTDRDTDPELLNGESFPEDDYYAPGDHNGCTCEWVISSTGG